MITEIPRVKLTHVFAPQPSAEAHAAMAVAAVQPTFIDVDKTANFVVSDSKPLLPSSRICIRPHPFESRQEIHRSDGATAQGF
jgi:hypothetical protein